MNRYQIVEITENQPHAGSKATADFAKVAEKMGFVPVPIRMDTTKAGALAKLKRQKGYARDYRATLKTIEPGAVILVQHPFHYPQLTREKTLRRLKERGCHFIGVVHDVEALRKFRDSEYYEREFRFMLQTDEVLIVHNEVMKQYFVEQGYPEDQLVVLEIFDYLQENACPVTDYISRFERSVTVAGNLDVTKCGYIGELPALAQAGVMVHLYGPNYDETKMQNERVRYEGVFPSDEIPSHLKSGFGLVWDGSSIKGCVGDSGQYLRYNNPHKLSLYLSSNLPVVIWKEAAEAAFVQRMGVGLVVDSLLELPAILSKMEVLEYTGMCERVAKLSEQLRQGEYAGKALKRSLEILAYDLNVVF